MCEISVLVPAYNTGKYIGECVESILRQTYDDLEIIIVDDGSDDDTLAVANQYARLDSRIRVITTVHQGVAEARNECLRNATGKYVLFVDSDDWTAPNLCENLYREAKRTSADIVFAPMVMVSTDGVESIFGDRSIVFNDNEVLTGSECFVRMVHAGCAYPMVAGNLNRRSLFTDNAIKFKGEYHEDEYSFPFILKSATRVCNLFESMYFYRQHRNSIMNCQSKVRGRAMALGYIAHEFEKELLSWNEAPAIHRFVRAMARHISGLKKKANALYDTYISQSVNNTLLLITEKSISSNYGIGTYIRNIVLSSPDTAWDIIQVEMNAYDRFELDFSVKDFLPCYTFPLCKQEKLHGASDNMEDYQTGVFYYIASRLGKNNRKIICHINAYSYDRFATLIKERLGARIIFTVHYMEWSFRLYGNRKELETILEKENHTIEEISIVATFEKEKCFLNDCCDQVIAIARHSYDILHQLYKIPTTKLTLIYNSVQNLPKVSLSKDKLREKYGFSHTDKIIIYAGRIDSGKGIFELAEAFKQVSTQIPELRLIIAGDGAYTSLYQRLNPVWSKVCLTGYVNPTTLNELYHMSDIGIVPSLHEEFGYVAVEMAAAGLPTLVNLKGGLKEIASAIPGVSRLNEGESETLQRRISSHLMTLKSETNVPYVNHDIVSDKSFSNMDLWSLYRRCLYLNFSSKST